MQWIFTKEEINIKFIRFSHNFKYLIQEPSLNYQRERLIR